MEDRIKGMIVGGALGDALGAPHEFRTSSAVYTGRLEHEATFFNRFTRTTTRIQVGQITDDTEMMLIIARRLIEDGEYVMDNVLLDYMKWANHKTTFAMGRNTRNLFKGVKTLRGYENRVRKFADPNCQSNGSLMRAGIFFLRPLEEALEDVRATNDNEVNLEVARIYHTLGSMALRGASKDELLDALEGDWLEEVTIAMEEAIEGVERDIVKSKGWVLHGLYVALYSLFQFDDYKSAIDRFAGYLGSDTDTNACIAGWLLGAYYGYEHIVSSERENVNILLECTTSEGDYERPAEYRLNDLNIIVQELMEL